jgi:uncharacterized NAD(P)/FAD-binding protein YdhS
LYSAVAKSKCVDKFAAGTLPIAPRKSLSDCSPRTASTASKHSQRFRDVLPISIDSAHVPFGTSLAYLARWFRDLVLQTEATGGDWRSVVHGLRPYNQRLWQSWSNHTKRQFLRHLRPWWNVHRHHLPSALHDRLVRTVAVGQVRLIAAEFMGVEPRDDHVRAQIRRRGSTRCETLNVAGVY